VSKQRHNKELHPTAYSLRFGRKLPSLRLPAAGEIGCPVDEAPTSVERSGNANGKHLISSTCRSIDDLRRA